MNQSIRLLEPMQSDTRPPVLLGVSTVENGGS
jgi:hypothetical protein